MTDNTSKTELSGYLLTPGKIIDFDKIGCVNVSREPGDFELDKINDKPGISPYFYKSLYKIKSLWITPNL